MCMSCYVWTEPWGQDIHSHGDVGDGLCGAGRAESGADVRELGAADGYEVEYLRDGATDWC